MTYITILYLLLLSGQFNNATPATQGGYATTYTANGRIADAHLVANDPRFPSAYYGGLKGIPPDPEPITYTRPVTTSRYFADQDTRKGRQK